MTESRLMLLGGDHERIEQENAHWLNGNMGSVPGGTEFIALPD